MLIEIDKRFLPFVFGFASLLQCSSVQSCPTTLENIVSYEGEKAAFTREPNDNGAAIWQIIPSSVNTAAKNITDSSYSVIAPFVGLYAADSTQLQVLHSTIVQGSATYSTAGLYFLKYTTPACTTAAGLVVVKSGPVCTCVVLNPSRVRYTCSVEFANYANQQINPIMTWINSSGIASVDYPKPQRLDLPTVNNGRQNSTSQVTVANTDATAYECQMNFSNAFAVAPYAATNAPNFTASCYITNCALPTIIPTTTIADTTSSASTTTTKTMDTTTTASNPTTKTIETTSSASTTISDTTTTNPTATTTTAPLSTTTAELLSTTAAQTSATTSVATSSLPITTFSSTESETQAVITVLVLSLVSLSTFTLVMLSWWFCLCQTPAASAAKTLATPWFAPRMREVDPWSFYPRRGIYEGREANPYSFYPRRGIYEGREVDPWSFYPRRGIYEGREANPYYFYSRGGIYEDRQRGRPRFESYERYY